YKVTGVQTCLFRSVGGSASGNVALTANGAAADLAATVDRKAITAARGSISVTAGRDILLGTAGANFDNDVRADGSVTLAAPGDIVIDGLANVVSDDFLNDTSGGVTATAGGAINIVNNQGAGASLGAGGNGDVVLTAGAD